jgi:hypothetical protein
LLRTRYYQTSSGFLSFEVRIMRRLSTPRFRFGDLVQLLGLVLLTSALVHGQSLGDVARANREKKAAAGSSATKVITNADLSKDEDASPPAEKTQAAPSAQTSAASRQAAEQRVAEERAAEQWKRKILAQEHVVANLQGRVDALKATIQFVDPGAYYNGYLYNQYQARQVERLKVLETQLTQEKRMLEELQEAARHAGMHTPVYDP